MDCTRGAKLFPRLHGIERSLSLGWSLRDELGPDNTYAFDGSLVEVVFEDFDLEMLFMVDSTECNGKLCN
jgi:hypothetical protein